MRLALEGNTNKFSLPAAKRFVIIAMQKSCSSAFYVVMYSFDVLLPMLFTSLNSVTSMYMEVTPSVYLKSYIPLIGSSLLVRFLVEA